MIESLQKFKDIHKGNRIWICGSGGSLLDIIPEQIPLSDIVICCNSSTYHFKSFDYAVFTDETANWSEWCLGIADRNCKQINCNEAVVSVAKDCTYLDKDFSAWKFNESDTKVIGGYDVIHCATHIAWIMGASEIILAGVDLKHISPEKKYAYSQDTIESTPESLTQSLQFGLHANPSLFDGSLGLSLSGWNMINQFNPDLNIKTISNDTNLTIYPYESFESLCKMK